MTNRTRRGARRSSRAVVEAPTAHNWRTSDEDEIDRRRWRAATERFQIVNQAPDHPIFSNFRVRSGSGLTYSVEVRDVERRQFHCECVDFRINGLGTCKHVEALLGQLQARQRRAFAPAVAAGSTRIDVTVDAGADTLRVEGGPRAGRWPRALRNWFGSDGRLREAGPEEAVDALRKVAAQFPVVRVSQEVEPWLESRRRARERRQLRHEYELRVQKGEWPAHETKVPLFPYQRDGMLHLAFTERALLADEMGLGKTIQAIAACALLHRLGQARRVLVVTPASLKTEWEEQIQRFTSLPFQLVFGARHERLKAYERAGSETGPFFTIVNYEQMLADALEVNDRIRPDIVVLDEAQRIKNWSTKTTQAVKRLRSRYAFVLTGTPIENRIDELYSLMDFLDPTVLGPLFRFNREYYQLDERGRPQGYRQLARLQERVRPFLLRRRKSDVETELPERTDRNFFVPLTPAQQMDYDGFEAAVARLANIARRRPLTQQEQDRLLRTLGMMRMTCDTTYILNPDDRSCAKLSELEKILEECRENAGVKIIIFSEWERMLELVRELCQRLGLGHAWHTGSVPQLRRRAEINAFKSDPQCRVFLSTDSGSTGLNLQNASVVINCDLPWNPAKLEQRIARAWRKHQTRPVTVINLVAEKTIEQRMLDTLAQKQALSDGVLDGRGDLENITLRTGRQAFFEKLQQLGVGRDAGIAPGPAGRAPAPAAPARAPLPADRPLGFARAARQHLNGAVLRCEERYPQTEAPAVLYVVVDRDAPEVRPALAALHAEYFGDLESAAPVRLEIVDRATDEALERLIAAGVVARTQRAARPLPVGDDPAEAAALSEAERSAAAERRTLAARKLKMARVLGDTGFGEEARGTLLEAAFALGRALAVENRLPEPASLDDALTVPHAHLWAGDHAAIRALASNPDAAWGPVAQALAIRLG